MDSGKVDDLSDEDIAKRNAKAQKELEMYRNELEILRTKLAIKQTEAELKKLS